MYSQQPKPVCGNHAGEGVKMWVIHLFSVGDLIGLLFM